jgi:tetratricopeptide (TPR) repeat protein
MNSHHPTSATADLLQSGIAAHQAGRLTAAEEVYRRILDAEPAHPEALHLLGLIALQSDKPALAVELIEAANDGRPGNAVILSNLAEAFQRLGCFEDARRCGEQAIARDSASVGAHVNLGNALRMLGQFDRAEACFRRADELDPAAGLPRLNLAFLRLMRGAYDEGFELYECRLDDANLPSTGDTRRLLKLFAEHAIPRWQGEPLHGRSLLVWTEQGLGDSLMMMRYLPQLKQSGAARLAVCCEQPLVRIMRATPRIDAVFSDTAFVAAEPRFDLQCPMMSLPLRMATRLDTIPRDVPYVRVTPELRQQWSARVDALPGLRVGLVWAGGRKTTVYPQRSVPLAAFAPVLDTPGCTFVSLQKDDAAAQLQRDTSGIRDFMGDAFDLMDTAALVVNLDLVISIDTSVAHLAGALGKPVWLLNRFGSDWRWLLERADNPWYPTMTIFRQESGDWNAVMHRVAAALKAAVRERSAAGNGWRGRLRQLSRKRRP